MNDTPDTFALAGQTLASKYAVERVVAKGGFGTVYFARHVELQTPVAVKVLMVPDRFQGELRAEFLEKFKLEARTIASLAHAAIVRVLDYGSATFVTGESPWMALEWLEGRTLEQDIEDRGAGVGRSPRETLDLLRPAFDALACAHEAGIAHRDIKPANMMIVKARRGEPSLRILDFGIAKAMEPDEQPGSGQTATQTELTSFSLLYAAPEQLSRARTGPWTDVHALALVITEVLIGARAYNAEDATQLYSDIVGRERPTPGRHGAAVGPWEPVFARALSLRPAERFANAADLLAALEATVAEAESAWVAARDGVAPSKPRESFSGVRTDTLMGASSAAKPRARGAWWLPVGAGLALSLLGAGVYAVTHADAEPVHPEPARPTPSPVTPSPVTPAVDPVPAAPARPEATAADASAPPVEVAEPAEPPGERSARHGHRRDRRTSQRTPPDGHPAATPSQPPSHSIVIE
jgi:serine/threonine protein kinase